MTDIPMPNVLRPDRPRLDGELSDDDLRAQTKDLAAALDRATEYGQHLWRQLDAVRHHLLAILPTPDADSEAGRVLTAPRGPADDAGWERWQTAYASVTSVLAGPAGDSGLGVHEAAREAMERRGPTAASDRTADLVAIADERRQRVEEQRTDAVVPGHGADQTNLTDASPWPGADASDTR